jgi:hypothetical protein
VREITTSSLPKSFSKREGWATKIIYRSFSDLHRQIWLAFRPAPQVVRDLRKSNPISNLCTNLLYKYSGAPTPGSLRL